MDEINIRLSPDYICHRDNPVVIIEGYKEFYYRSKTKGHHEFYSARYRKDGEIYNQLMSSCDKIAEEVRSMVMEKLI